MLYVIGARRPNHLQLGGSGSSKRKCGTDGTMASGITGAHRRRASLQLDGLGIRATGIIVVTSSDMLTDAGTGSKAGAGSSMAHAFQSSQLPQEAQKYADLSICSRNGASHPHFRPRKCQDAKSVKALRPWSLCGPTRPHVASSEEDSSTTNVTHVKLESHTLGRE